MSCEKGSGGIDPGRKGTLMQKRSLAGEKDCERASFLEKGFWMKMTFYEKMAVVCRRIPRGTVATYGQIALLCGYPTHARQVGYGLKHELAGADIPAHRVVNAKGILSGAASFETWDMQKQLLTGEGVEVLWTEDGWKVDLKKFGWKNTMEEAEAIALSLQMCYTDRVDGGTEENAGEK